MSTATLVRMVRDPRSGQVHLPNETVSVLAVMQNIDRTLLKVRWQAGGDCVVFPEDLESPDVAPLMKEATERQPQARSLADVARFCTEL